MAQHRPKHDVHLELRKGGAEAPANASTERDPGIRIWLVADVAVRIKACGIGVKAGVGVHS